MMSLKVLPTKGKQMHVNKEVVMKRQIHILSSSKIIKPVTHMDYINIDIPRSPLDFKQDGKEYIVAFKDGVFLDSLKSYINHPYVISNVKVGDVLFYLNKTKSNLMVITDCKCDVDERVSKYTATVFDIDSIDSDMDTVPVQVHKFVF
jgi:hypothetical protein